MDEMEQAASQEPAQETPFGNARRAYSWALISLVIYSLCGKSVRILTVYLLKHFGLYENMSETLLYFVMFAPMYLVAFPVYLLISKPFPKFPPKSPKKLGFPVMSTVFFVAEGLGVLGAMIGALVTALVSVAVGTDITDTTIQQGVTGDGVLIFTVIAALIAPVVEEMLFRKVLIDRVRVYGDGTAILLSGLFFGLFHGNFMQVFFASTIGLLFAYIYVRTGKIRYTITLHIIINSLSTVVAGGWMRMVQLNKLTQYLSIDSYSEVTASLTPIMHLMTGLLRNRLDIVQLTKIAVDEPLRALLISVPGIGGLLLHSLVIYSIGIAGLILLIVHRKQFHVEPPQIPLGKGQNRLAVLSSVGFWAMTLFCVWLFISNIFG